MALYHCEIVSLQLVLALQAISYSTGEVSLILHKVLKYKLIWKGSTEHLQFLAIKMAETTLLELYPNPFSAHSEVKNLL